MMPRKKAASEKAQNRLPAHAREHLAASGLSPADTRRLGLQWLSAEEAARRLRMPGFPCGGILFPYFDPAGKVRPEAFRVRLLPDPRDGWPERPVPKYLQPPGSPVRAYLPPLATDWKEVAGNGRDLLVTEGEKKAAAACKAGFATLGLGGVWSFKQKDLAADFLPDLASLSWRRRVWIAYDSDWRENKDVRRAALALAQRLASRGAEVRALLLEPGLDGEKVGLDDFLVARGPAALQEALDAAPALTPEWSEMAEYRERFVLVRTVSSAYDTRTHTLFTRKRFEDAYPDETIESLTPAGTPTRVTKAAYWWQDPHKQTAERLVLRPGQPQLTDEGDLNTFRGWGTVPKAGSTKVWTKLLETVFQGRRSLIRWFEQWLAYPLQHPGTKLHQAVFVFGGQGTGKSAIGQVVVDIYGASGRVIQDREIFSGFNGWLASTLFASGDDLCFDERRKSRAQLKLLVDSPLVEVNEKYIPSYRCENRCNFYLTANKPGALPLDPGGLNRRFLVIEAPHDRSLPQSWYLSEFHKWRAAGGPAAVHAHLLKVSLKGFHPYQDAPESDAKATVVASSRSNVEAWCAEIAQHCPYELTTAKEAYQLYRAQTEDRRTGLAAFTQALRDHAVPCGQQRDGQGGHLCLWALRHAEKWVMETPTGRVKQYRHERAQDVTGGR